MALLNLCEMVGSYCRILQQGRKGEAQLLVSTISRCVSVGVCWVLFLTLPEVGVGRCVRRTDDGETFLCFQLEKTHQ